MLKIITLALIIVFVRPTFGLQVRSLTSTKIQTHKKNLSENPMLGQLLMIGITGKKLTERTKLKLKDLRPGGIILFSRNISSAEQLAKLTYDLQEYAQELDLPPFFIAIDQEGGSVTRLKSWPPLPSASIVGKVADVNLAFKLAFFSGQVMQTLGLNMNLAPVLDLGQAYGPSFLGSRAYSHDPAIVEAVGSATLLGYKAAGVVPVAKHFPGHGAATGDSHRLLPTSILNKTVMLSSHLKPFAKSISDKSLTAVMAAHVSFPKIDPSRLPATYSRVILTEQLRETMGFDGLILTDDVEMQAAKRFQSASARTLQSLAAGADIVMIAWNLESQYQAKRALLEALETGKLTQQRVQQSLDRIALAKEDLSTHALATRAELKSLVYHRELYHIIDLIYSKSSTQVIRSTKKRSPAKVNHENKVR